MIFLHDKNLLTYLSSCQNEFVSNSGSTSVAFMIRAATTALHICKIKAAVTLNLSAMLPWTHKPCMMNYATLETKFLMLIILHFVVGTSRHCTGHASTHCSQIQLVGLQVERSHFRISFCHHTEWHKTGAVTSGSRRIQRNLRGQ